MLILYETPAGYALFKVLNNKKLSKIENVYKYFQDGDKAKEIVNLSAFTKFKDTKDALTSTNKLIKGKLPKKLQKFLNKNIITQEVQENLAIADKKLAKIITDKMGIQCQSDDLTKEIFRGLRSQADNLVSGMTQNELKSMTLGLAHGLSRFKLKFSIDKVDTMIIQAIALLDDLDKEVNNYMMRLREWYGFHFPELNKIITDNLIYAKVVQMIGMRNKTAQSDLSGIITEDIEKEVKEAAEISMGAEINDEDEKYIINLATQVIELSEYRSSLSEYLKNRMNAIAPNLTVLVGELVGARLIAHAGSLVSLAKYPASTVQILGAEKALFKAIRTKHNTPKYGLIYQASIVGQSQNKLKGKVSRTLAAKCAICIRVDALGEDEDAELGVECKQYIEKRVAFLEGGNFNKDKKQQKQGLEKQSSKQAEAVSQYNQKSDFAIQSLSSSFKKSNTLVSDELPKKKVKKE